LPDLVNRGVAFESRPTVKTVIRNFHSVQLICLALPNGVVAVFVDQQCIYDGDKKACIVQHLSYGLPVAPSVLHDDPCFSGQLLQKADQFPQLCIRMGHLKRFRNYFAERPHNGYCAFPLGNIDPYCVHFLYSSQSISFKLAAIVFSLPIQIAWSHEHPGLPVVQPAPTERYSGRMADCLAAGHG
jgi:hypothetical protein